MNHPLTDEICQDIAPWRVNDPGVFECMRTAAEWQLIQAIEWWKTFLIGTGLIPPPVVNLIAEEFKQEMRPTQEDN